MHIKRRRLLPHFETCSVALFVALALCGPLQARAQTDTTASATAQVSPAATQGSIPPNSWTARQISEAFREGDKNGDGRLSREEAALWAGLSRRFDQVDTDKDGSISSAEFDEALK